MLETTKIKINNTYFLKLVIPPRTLNANLLFYCVETVTFSGSSITFIFNFLLDVSSCYLHFSIKMRNTYLNK